jgi:hypothetical protein
LLDACLVLNSPTLSAVTAVIFCLSLGYYRPVKVIKNGTLNGFGCSAEEWSQTSNPAKINSVDVLVGHLSSMHSSIALIYHAVLATKWPISWQVTH